MEQRTEKSVTTHEDIFHKVHLSLFTSGLAKEIGATKFFLLNALASYMKEDGFCYPTQEQLEERTGLTTKSIRKHLKELANMEVDKKTILKMAKYPSLNGHYHYAYKVLPLSQISKYEGGKIEKIKNPFIEAAVSVEDELAKVRELLND
ncbi:helix-turn-helix domain-containing protein [Priestia aryabhattai]|uniref:helix-turn-helix domain-containing protein n=1 Tax=Priestia aryabhattai TaxID=412384 RepID=UPI001C8E9E00|nr:helix-turn-helix domain-containing protein [Priestia aryabhattai]MBY0008797.1 helix-turn-helix domain-containing protein [Priestia aryabhattai]MBY0049995.1 helix-turn-helix domain-containing protein [Priestia aryabhattai]